MAILAAIGLWPARGWTAGEVAPRELLDKPEVLARWLAARHPDVMAARARVAQGSAEMAASRLLTNPTLELTLGTIPLGATNPSGLGFNDVVNYNIALAQLIEVGKRGPRFEAARWRRRAAASGVIDTLVQRMTEARLALARVAYLAARRAVLERVAKAQRGVLALERVRLQQGHLSGNDYDRLLLDNFALRSDLRRAAGEQQLAITACQGILLTSCGAITAAELTILDRFATTKEQPSAADLARRPDLRTLEHTRRAARAEGILARRKAIPDPTLTLTYTHDRFVVAGAQRNALTLGVQFPLPLFDRGQHEEQKARRRVQEVAAQLEGLKLRANAERLGLARRLRSLRGIVTIIRTRSLPRSARVLKTTLVAFQRGQLSLTDLLLARRGHTQLLLTALDLRFEAFTLGNELWRANGFDAKAARRVSPVKDE